MTENTKKTTPNIVDTLTKSIGGKILIMNDASNFKYGEHVRTFNGSLGKILYIEDNSIFVNIITGSFIVGDVLNDCSTVSACYEPDMGLYLFRNYQHFASLTQRLINKGKNK